MGKIKTLFLYIESLFLKLIIRLLIKNRRKVI